MKFPRKIVIAGLTLAILAPAAPAFAQFGAPRGDIPSWVNAPGLPSDTPEYKTADQNYKALVAKSLADEKKK